MKITTAQIPTLVQCPCECGETTKVMVEVKLK